MMDWDQQLDDAVLAILSALHAEVGDEHARSTQPGMSLAKLSKRVEQRMSTLRRHLSALESAEIVSVVLNEDGTGRAALTPFGMAIFDVLNESHATVTA
jgi:DNA-binding transcriptional ArsR family regulator